MSKYCTKCGKQLDDDANVCSQCGNVINPQAVNQQPIIVNVENTNVNNNVNVQKGTPKNKWVAFLLCLFLGEFGIHRFYEGKIITGLLWLFTGGLFGIGWFIDTIILLFKPTTYYV